MLRDDVLDIVKRIPEKDHAKIQLVTRGGTTFNVEVFVRFENSYVCFRGREAGNVDEGRAFFVPFDEVTAVKIERIVKVSELKEMYGETASVGDDSLLSNSAKNPNETPNPVITPAPAGPLDPAQIAKQNLLARIRAARTAAGVGNN